MDESQEGDVPTLTAEDLSSYRIARVFKGHSSAPINTMGFSDSGRLLACSSDAPDSRLQVIDCEEGQQITEVTCRTHGVRNVQFTHHDGSVLHSSGGRGDDPIRYLSLPTHRYLRYFTGHTDRIVSLAISPADDTFISGAVDGSVRMWDLRQPACTGRLTLRGQAAVGFDPKGLCFAVTSCTGWLRLYDVRMQSRGPFTMLRPCTTKGALLRDITQVRFSTDGELILLSAGESSIVMVLDAFKGDRVSGRPPVIYLFVSMVNPHLEFADYPNESGSRLGAAFSPCGQFVMGGDENGNIHVWQVRSQRKVGRWSGHAGNHPAPRIDMVLAVLRDRTDDFCNV